MSWGTRPGEERAGLTAAVLLCAAFVGWLLLWAALDRRPPDDHDDFYTHRSIPAAWAAAEAGPVEKVGVYVRHFREGRLHPQLAQTSLVAAMGSFGVSRFVFRAANAPWLFLLLFGTFLLARELSGPRLALLAVFLVGTLPIVLNYSRKWDIQFHAACLVPLGLWLGLKALRSGGRWWAGFAVWQGLRFYSHPILVPDIAVTVGLVGLAHLAPALWARDGEDARRRLIPLLGVGLGVAVMGLWYTGVAGGLIGEPDYSLRRYVQRRHSYTEGAWIQGAALVAIVRLGADLIRETFWLHLMPGAAFLLVGGLIALPGRLIRRPPAEPATYWAEWMLLGTVLAQIPPAGLAASNRAYLNDWLFVFPTTVVLALIALRCAASRLASERRRRLLCGLWLVAAVANGLWVAGAPVVASLTGPDPLEKPDHYASLPIDLFTHSTSGRHLTTHHMVTRRPLAHARAAVLAREALGPDRSTLELGILDLTWDPGRYGASGCRLGDPGHRAAWSFRRPPESTPAGEPMVSPWPFAFEGFEQLELTVSGSGFDETTMPRLVAVRLWLQPTERWVNEPHPCDPFTRLPEGVVARAEQFIKEGFGDRVRIVGLEDPTGAFVGRTIEWVPDPTYLGLTLWVDRGPSAVGLQKQPDEDV